MPKTPEERTLFIHRWGYKWSKGFSLVECGAYAADALDDFRSAFPNGLSDEVSELARARQQIGVLDRTIDHLKSRLDMGAEIHPPTAMLAKQAEDRIRADERARVLALLNPE
jgi:hypothetical protein